jgi:hypothetical protein
MAEDSKKERKDKENNLKKSHSKKQWRRPWQKRHGK